MTSIKNFLARGTSTSKEIQAALGLSQSTVSRMLKKMGDRIVQISEGRFLSAASRQKLFPFTPGGGSNRTV
ncbi:ArsR family transcriptional regulator [Desulfotignum phosphitoxidans]|jgi:DNA-binding transcriptional regulator GbsR (MarR family)|uniref:Transcriptional regulator ArsR family n=1 Tax=Desulfotignum phosphitoxidans DSM 13687 TaxID=1286635 RepID=S0FTL1_9BACT|nr:ArsR family transcriptional regulator [Desulfotignum phosphitoxidans]EMS78030.1 transcriptional regulator ArsR family [Desulfotignum phosphitoxidans DSM 13687]